MASIGALIASVFAVCLTNADAAAGGGGVFVAVKPTRIYESSATGSSRATSTAGVVVKALGAGGVPASGVSAVVVDVAARSTTGTTNVYVKTSGQDAQSSVLSTGGTTGWQTNTVVVKPSSSGNITVETSSQPVDFNIDVQGYFTSSSTDASIGGFVVLDSPTRLLGTNTGIGLPQAKLAAGTTYPVQVANRSEIPTSATAIFANVRVLNASASGSLKIGASGSGVGASVTSVTYNPNDYSDSGMSIKLSSSGKLDVYISSGTADVIIDVQGYFTSGSDGASFTPLANASIFDSRPSQTLAAGQTRIVRVAGVAEIPWSESGAVAVTIAALNGTASGSASIFNPDFGEPGTSNVAWKAPYDGQPDQSTAIVPISDTGTVAVKNNTSGSVDIRLSVQGWFTRVHPMADQEDSPDSDGDGLLTPAPQGLSRAGEATLNFQVPLLASASSLQPGTGGQVEVRSASGVPLGTFEAVALDGNGVPIPCVLTINGRSLQVALTVPTSSALPVAVVPVFSDQSEA